MNITAKKLQDNFRPQWRNALLATALAVVAAPTLAQETFKIGIVSFLSGQAAESLSLIHI